MCRPVTLCRCKEAGVGQEDPDSPHCFGYHWSGICGFDSSLGDYTAQIDVGSGAGHPWGAVSSHSGSVEYVLRFLFYSPPPSWWLDVPKVHEMVFWLGKGLRFVDAAVSATI